MPRRFPQEVVKAYAEWLRASKLELHDGVIQGKRVQFFSGKKLKDFFMANQHKMKKVPGVDILDESDFIDLANRMVKAGYFHKATIKPPSKNRDYTLLHPTQGLFNKEAGADLGVWVWILEPSQLKAFLYSFGLLFVLLLLCMFKLWPLWAKLAIWWLALIFLVSMLGILVVRLPVTAILWILGFRGMWMFPNILNEEIGVMDTFTPLFGYGIEEDEKRRRLAEQRARKQKRKEEENKEAAKAEDENEENEQDQDKAAPTDEASKKEEEARKKEEAKKAAEAKLAEDSNWKFGLINFILLCIVGLFACQQFGLMSAEMIPEMFVSQEEIWNTYPSLLSAAPETSQEETDKAKEKIDLDEDEEEEKTEEEIRMEELVEQELADDVEKTEI
eukprot:g58024.t1